MRGRGIRSVDAIAFPPTVAAAQRRYEAVHLARRSDTKKRLLEEEPFPSKAISICRRERQPTLRSADRVLVASDQGWTSSVNQSVGNSRPIPRSTALR